MFKQFRLPARARQLDHLRDVQGRVAGIGRVGEQLAHLVGGLEVEVIAFEASFLRARPGSAKSCLRSYFVVPSVSNR